MITLAVGGLPLTIMNTATNQHIPIVQIDSYIHLKQPKDQTQTTTKTRLSDTMDKYIYYHRGKIPIPACTTSSKGLIVGAANYPFILAGTGKIVVDFRKQTDPNYFFCAYNSTKIVNIINLENAKNSISSLTPPTTFANNIEMVKRYQTRQKTVQDIMNGVVAGTACNGYTQ
jgi:hypothetical protein